MLSGPPGVPNAGSRDGATAADHDQPFVFGHHLTASNVFPFTPRQFARLLCLRSHVDDGDRVPEILVLANPARFGVNEPDPDEEPVYSGEDWPVE